MGHLAINKLPTVLTDHYYYVVVSMTTDFNNKQDSAVVQDVVAKIKDGIRTIPKLDVLSMPYRVSLVKVGAYG